jgi:hypothetical protein
MKPSTAAAQRIDRSRPPETANPGGAFTVRRLDGPVSINGQAWIPIRQVSASGTMRPPNVPFTLTLEEASTEEVVHFRIYFEEPGGSRVLLDSGSTTYAFVTPDARWIITSPLVIIDVANWRRYSLSQAFNIEPFVVLRAISSDGRRLFVSRQVCPFDCRNTQNEYYEIGLPAGNGKL